MVTRNPKLTVRDDHIETRSRSERLRTLRRMRRGRKHADGTEPEHADLDTLRSDPTVWPQPGRGFA